MGKYFRESIQCTSDPVDIPSELPSGGIPARNHKGERLLLFVGIIDILQSYRLVKKIEHTFKAMIHDGVSGFFFSSDGENHFSRTLCRFIDPDFMLRGSLTSCLRRFSRRFHHVSLITLKPEDQPDLLTEISAHNINIVSHQTFKAQYLKLHERSESSSVNSLSSYLCVRHQHSFLALSSLELQILKSRQTHSITARVEKKLIRNFLLPSGPTRSERFPQEV